MYYNYRPIADINRGMARVYLYMGLAVLNSMLISYFVSTSPSAMAFFFTGAMKWVTIFAPLFFVVAISIALNTGVGTIGAHTLLHIFAAAMGLSFATIFTHYTSLSIAGAFGGAAVLFIIMSIYGYVTEDSLDTVGALSIIGLISIIVIGVINIFIGSSLVQLLISIVGILVFLGLTAYDTQKIRERLLNYDDSTTEVSATIALYLDFINMFLNLLTLFGVKKD